MTDESLGYEQAREELAEVVRRLEAGGLSLEESLALWERGERLADVCAQWLDGARAPPRRRPHRHRRTRRQGHLITFARVLVPTRRTRTRSERASEQT